MRAGFISTETGVGESGRGDTGVILARHAGKNLAKWLLSCSVHCTICSVQHRCSKNSSQASLSCSSNQLPAQRTITQPSDTATHQYLNIKKGVSKEYDTHFLPGALNPSFSACINSDRRPQSFLGPMCNFHKGRGRFPASKEQEQPR